MIIRALIVIAGINAALFGWISNARSQDNNPFSGATSINVTMTRTVTGTASWYGYESGTRTASGERFNPKAMTCAMRRRDWGTMLIVTVIATGVSADCRLTDYGPDKKTGRLIDVSEGMAKKLGFHGRGLAAVTVQ